MPSIFDPAPENGRQAESSADFLRIGVAEREEAVAILNSAWSEGRLTPEEYSRRTAAVAAAVIKADLQAVLADLPAGSIENLLRENAMAASMQAASDAQHAQWIRERDAIAKNLLRELAQQTLGVLGRRSSPRGVEITSVRYGIPGIHRVGSIRVQTGRVFMLTLPPQAAHVRHNALALSDAAEFHTFQVPKIVLHGRYEVTVGVGGLFPVTGPKVRAREPHTKGKVVADFEKSIAAATQGAGGTFAICNLQPVQAHGVQQTYWDSDRGHLKRGGFYLDENGRLVHDGLPAEEAVARWLS